MLHFPLPLHFFLLQGWTGIMKSNTKFDMKAVINVKTIMGNSCQTRAKNTSHLYTRNDIKEYPQEYCDLAEYGRLLQAL